MKLLHKDYTKGESGSMKLLPEESEDMWHAYNLIREGDNVTATTLRKVAKDSGVGAESERIKLKLTVQVEGVEYDAEGSSIRLRGKNLTENDHVKLGAYHTLELEPHRAFTLYKAVWDALDVDRVRQASDPALSADLAAVLITEGLANVCLVGSSTTLVRAKIEVNLPRKRGAAIAGFDKAWNKFLDAVLNAVVRNVDFGIVKCLVIAGPGFAKEQFKSKIVLAPASSAYKHALKEVFSAPGIASQIKNTKAARETEVLQEFYKMLAEDPGRAFYGPGHVFAAAELGAIQTLMLADSMFRISDVAKRQRYVALVDGVTEAGGEALVFSSMHVTGEQLMQLSGIAAVLRFPLDEIADEDIPRHFKTVQLWGKAAVTRSSACQGSQGHPEPV